jgi:hypothetical protein
VFAATLKVTVAGPVPDAALVIVIQAAFEAAVHAQPTPVVMAVDPLPPLASTSCDCGAIEYVHAAACDAVNV